MPLMQAADQSDREPLMPELCLHHVYTVHDAQSSTSATPASLALFTADFTGMRYFCLLMNAQLHVWRLSVTGDAVTVVSPMPTLIPMVKWAVALEVSAHKCTHTLFVATNARA